MLMHDGSLTSTSLPAYQLTSFSYAGDDADKVSHMRILCICQMDVVVNRMFLLDVRNE
jgi:hypothetical protein